MRALLEELAGLVAEVEALLDDSGEPQWLPSRLTGKSHDLDYSDPTGDTVTDPRRLALREEVRRAEATLSLTQEHLSAARTRLRVALDRWAGEG